MAEEGRYNNERKGDECESGVETTDRGMFDFLGKKEEKKHSEEEVMVSQFDKVKVSEEPEPKVEECKEEEKNHSLLDKFHQADGSSSSSSSDEEEVEEGGEKIKKKKKKGGLKEKILGGGDEHEKKKKEEERVEKYEDTSVPVEKCEEPAVVVTETSTTHEPEEKKGFLDKIKEKLPGHKKTEEVEVAATPPPPPPSVVEHSAVDSEPKEKKGILEKIKEKLPGYHTKTEEEKEKEK